MPWLAPVTIATCCTAGLFVAAADDFGDTARLAGSLAFEGELVRRLDATRNLVDAEQLHAESEVGTDWYRRHEPHLVAAVVDAHLETGRLEDHRHHHRTKRQRQVAVGDRSTERALFLCSFGIDVNPLKVASRFGELVHPLLGDLHPI